MDLRSTLAERAGDLTVPADLLGRVETGARRVRRRRALTTGSALVAVAAVAVGLTLPGHQTASHITPAVRPTVSSPDTGTCAGPGVGTASPASGSAATAPLPANLLDWPCRGGGLTLLPPELPGAPGEQSAHALWEGHTADGRQVGIFQTWRTGDTLARTATVVERGRSSLVTLPADTAAIVARLPGDQGDVGGDSEGLVVVAAPGVTSAVYDDGLGHTRSLPLTDNVYVGLRDRDRAVDGVEGDGVTLTRPTGTVRIGVDEQESPTTTVPAMAGLADDAARRALATAGLDGGPATATATLPVGGSSPAAGAVLATGSRVTLAYRRPDFSASSPTPTSAPPTGAVGAGGLAYPVPTSWAFRGDMVVYDRMRSAVTLAHPTTPLWAQQLGGTDYAVVLVQAGDAAGDITVQTWQGAGGGTYRVLASQTLIDGTRAFAAYVSGTTVLVLGPPGTERLSAGKAPTSTSSGAALIYVGATQATLPITATDSDAATILDAPISTRDSGLRD